MDTTVLDGPPRLGPLYARAALGALPVGAPRVLRAVLPGGGRTGDLPDRALVREDVVADPAEVAAYARLCGFRLDGALPPTYPHLLAFGLQMALMAQRGFPLPLPGLVHVRNTIAVRRPVDAAEPLRVRVHAERLRAHPKGAQVDLVAAVHAGDEPVWDGRSTYLSRGTHLRESGSGVRESGSGVSESGRTVRESGSGVSESGRTVRESGSGVRESGSGVRESGAGVSGSGPGEPAEPGAVEASVPSAVWPVDGDTGRRYAAVSGDVNPIHLHPLAARAFGFPRAIAHGMWTAARALAALQGRLPDAYGYDVVFAAPLLLPSTVELRTSAADGGWDLDVRAARSGRHHLRAAVRPA